MKVLIVGGGIGGLSAAIALRRTGADVDLVELNPRWDVYGVGIIQPGNALRALGMLGVIGECLAAGYPMEGVRSHDSQGNVLTDIDFALPPGVPGPMMNGLRRPAFHKILQDHTLRSGAVVRTGITVTSVDESGEVSLSDGTQTTYDLVIGADGINSKVRSLVFGDEVRPQYSGQIAWRYNLPRYPGLERLWMFTGSFGRAGFVPLAPDQMYVLLIEKAPGRPSGDGLAELMRERLAEYGGPVAEVRDQITDDEQVVVREVETILVPAPWYRGKVLLIGDAAHATSPHVGQGAAQAIEDAVVLAEELAAGDGALERFMGRRFERCRIVVEGSKQIGDWEKEGATDVDYPGTVERITNAVAAPL